MMRITSPQSIQEKSPFSFFLPGAEFHSFAANFLTSPVPAGEMCEILSLTNITNSHENSREKKKLRFLHVEFCKADTGSSAVPCDDVNIEMGIKKKTSRDTM